MGIHFSEGPPNCLRAYQLPRVPTLLRVHPNYYLHHFSWSTPNFRGTTFLWAHPISLAPLFLGHPLITKGTNFSEGIPKLLAAPTFLRTQAKLLQTPTFSEATPIYLGHLLLWRHYPNFRGSTFLKAHPNHWGHQLFFRHLPISWGTHFYEDNTQLLGAPTFLRKPPIEISEDTPKITGAPIFWAPPSTRGTNFVRAPSEFLGYRAPTIMKAPLGYWHNPSELPYEVCFLW